MESNILLESGTNELEVVEFTVGHSVFGINVIKVKKILNPMPVTEVPHAHPYVEGIVEIMGMTVPVIHLGKTLGLQDDSDPKNHRFILCEFNNIRVVFHVTTVSKIHRISWEQIQKPSTMVTGDNSHVIGVIKREGLLVLLLDYEKIVSEINPEVGLRVEDIDDLGERERSDKKIVIAEDSGLIRKMLKETLEKAGYTNLYFFENGAECLRFLESNSEDKPIEETTQLVITDIEMPEMDGHHLIKRIRENTSLDHLPVIIFSSLITDDLRHKGEKVGATNQVSKPEIKELVRIIDNHIL